MSTSPAEQGRLYTGLSGFLGPDLAGDLLNAIPDISGLATKEDLKDLEARLDSRFDKLNAKFDRHFYAVLGFLAVVVGWLFRYAS